MNSQDENITADIDSLKFPQESGDGQTDGQAQRWAEERNARNEERILVVPFRNGGNGNRKSELCSGTPGTGI